VPRTRVVIQSRLSSSRLPGKALLTIAGMPLVELVARRASRSGHEVVVATSEEQDDGRIAEHLRSVGVPVLRGPLDDVLGRFVLATADLDPTDRVVRLTGDNPVADADLVDELLTAVAESGHAYGRVDIDRVPEGLGAEVFSVGSLRLAAERATASYDREHVTPWLRRELGELLFVPNGPQLDPRRFRCTVDVLADYVRVSGLFTWQTDPVQVPWRTLMAELAGGLGEDAAYLPLRVQGSGMSALVLGLDQVLHADPSLVRRLLRVAQEHGVSHVDTGMAGEGGQALFRTGSEPAVVQRFSTIVRVGPRAVTGRRGAIDAVECGLERPLERALGDLGRRRCDVVLVDSVTAARADDGAAWQRLCAYRDAFEVNRIGVRVRTREELDQALRLPALGHLEVAATAGAPWWADGPLAAVAASGVVVSLDLCDPDGGDSIAALRTSPPWVASALISPRSERDLVQAVRQLTAP
jgi:spore coat polysaccharide biosynthesis protein SpsF